MSSGRVLRSQQHMKGKKAVRSNESTTKRGWVNTVNDLSVYKATAAELNHRHEMHQSHNKAAAQWELREKVLKQQLRHAISPAPLDKASISIIREVFSDQLLLQDVLARSDRAMAVVKDIFGDAPRRQTGHPSVTIAPNLDSDSDLPFLQRLDSQTQLSLSRESLIDQEALNELEGSEDDHEDYRPSQSSVHHVVRRSKNRKVKARSSQSNSNQRLRNNINVTPSTSRGAAQQTALNATGAVRRIRSKLNFPETERNDTPPPVAQVLSINHKGAKNNHDINRSQRFASQSSEVDGSSTVTGDQSSLGVLQAMLGQVEADLDSLSSETATAPSNHNSQHKQGLTGFSVALISTLGRLVHLLKQKEDVAQKELGERKRLEAAVTEQRGLIDALTAETMELREEVTVLRTGFQHHIAQLNTQNELIGAQLIQAQLSQANSTGSRIRAPPSRSSDETERTSASTQSAGERRSSSRRVQPCKSPVESANAQSQQTSPNTLSVHSVEQRILEVNRQSAAARSRLMELIEHQKQKVSSSASSGPPSECSTKAADRQNILELQPEPERWPHKERRSQGSDSSSIGSGRETVESNAQMLRRKQHEGWFALSSHMR